MSQYKSSSRSHSTLDLNRREFIKKAGIGAGLLTSPLWLQLPACQSTQPARMGELIPKDTKLNIAVVGCGGKGADDLHKVSSENIVALCDVDYGRAVGAFELFPKAARYSDFRKMLVEMDEQIDAVVCSTPDHMHFAVGMMAMECGKHLFIQKPLTHTVWEARQMTLAARRHKVVTQMGNQGHACDGVRRLKEWLDAGVIGPVREVHVWTEKLHPVAHAPYRTDFKERPAETPLVPSGLDWNAWLGIAPFRAYHPEYHPLKWRCWWEFGSGVLGDIGCHTTDGAFYALELGAPATVEAETAAFTEEVIPEWSVVTYTFPARKDKPPVKLVWHDGGKQPPRPEELEPDREMPIRGAMYIGDKGTIMDTSEKCDNPRLLPESRMTEFLKKPPPERIPRVPDQSPHMEWIRACKGGPKPGSNFDYAGPLAEMILLGNVAIRSRQKLEWDAESLTFHNAPEAELFLRKQYRVF